MRPQNAEPSNFIRTQEIGGRQGVPVACDLFNVNGYRKNGELRPALVFMHGGGFVEGSKDQFLGIASWLALTTDALCVTVEYRVAGQASCPAPIMDCLQVISWLHDKQESLAVCPDLFFLIGGSPGAQIAAMAMFDGRYAKGKFQPDNAIFLNGIYDMDAFYRRNPSEQKKIQKYLSISCYDKKILCRESPIFCIKPQKNILLLHGEKDKVVPVSEAEEMQAALRAGGSRAWLHIFKNKEHAWFNRQENQYEVLKVMEEFITFRKKEVLSNGN